MITKIREGMSGKTVAEIIDGNFEYLENKQDIKFDEQNTYLDGKLNEYEEQLKEFADKLSVDDKSKLETVLGELKEAHASKNMEVIDSKVESLNSTWSEISTKMYQNTDAPSSESPDDVEDITSTEV